jgi:decaprenylphospho-beta-D-erythro-pentofuranosid-2-ulose 2-reductase
MAYSVLGAMKRVIVIGASSGIGAELVKQLADRGDRVAAVARRTENLSRLAKSSPEGAVIAFTHDVTKIEEVPALFQEICHELGGLDMIVYAAGVMPEVGSDEFDTEKDRQMIEVNVTGAVAWLNQAAIRFQNTNSGAIVGIGSVAGERGRQGQPVYNTSKAALKTYLEALRNRLSKHGVKVVTIKPGPVATEMTAHMDQKKMMPAAKAAELILKKSERSGEHFLSPVHAVIFAIIRHIPSPIFRKLKF